MQNVNECCSCFNAPNAGALNINSINKDDSFFFFSPPAEHWKVAGCLWIAAARRPAGSTAAACFWAFVMRAADESETVVPALPAFAGAAGWGDRRQSNFPSWLRMPQLCRVPLD